MGEAMTIPLSTGKRAQSKAANRQCILEAARSVFARIGYEATTVRDIIRETNLAAGTFYNYFKSKEEVFEAISDESAARFRPLLKDVRARADGFEEFICGAYRAYFQFLADENAEALDKGAPHVALIGVRVDTPEMQAVFEEIRMDIERMIDPDEAPQLDSEYLTAAAIGIARELGDHMLARSPVDVEMATTFASSLLIAGLKGLPDPS
ncbi:MAG: helix-turn-helix domain-containing protein [Pseudomonadota bacterium]